MDVHIQLSLSSFNTEGKYKNVKIVGQVLDLKGHLFYVVSNGTLEWRFKSSSWVERKGVVSQSMSVSF